MVGPEFKKDVPTAPTSWYFQMCISTTCFATHSTATTPIWVPKSVLQAPPIQVGGSDPHFRRVLVRLLFLTLSSGLSFCKQECTGGHIVYASSPAACLGGRPCSRFLIYKMKDQTSYPLQHHSLSDQFFFNPCSLVWVFYVPWPLNILNTVITVFSVLLCQF